MLYYKKIKEELVLKKYFYSILVFILAVCPANATASTVSDYLRESLILPLSAEPKTLNVLVAQENASAEIGQYLFDGLTRFNPKTGDMEPALSEKWTAADKGKTWTFYLRENVFWSDGEPFTAEDVRWTFEDVIYNPEIPNGARDIFTIAGERIKVKIINDFTIEFDLPEPFAPFLFALSQSILPKHKLSRAILENRFSSAWGLGENPENIVGTGPFKVHKILAGEKIELVQNDFYWRKTDAGEKLPKIKRIVFLVMPSAENQLLRFLEGETDFFRMRGTDYPILKPLEGKNNFKIYNTGASLGSFFLAVNQQTTGEWKRDILLNRDFRRALSYAMDRNSMADMVFNRFAAAQCSPLSPSIPFFYNDNTACYSRDFEAARKILQEILGFVDADNDGFLEDKNGRTLEFVLMTNAEEPSRLQIAQMLREDFRRVGIKIVLQVVEFNSLVSRLTVTKNWEMVLMGLTGSLDPHFGANVWLSNGQLHFWNLRPQEPSYIETKIDKIFAAAAQTIDRDERKKLYDEWQAIEAEELFLIPTVVPDTLFAVRNRFKKIEATAVAGAFYPIEELEVKTNERA